MVKKSLKSVRLTPNITPLHYKLFLKPDLEGFTFDGEEAITLNLYKPTKKITLHSSELEIISANVILNDNEGSPDGALKTADSSGRTVRDIPQNDNEWVGEISYDEKAETATFTFPKVIPAGESKLKINFTGILNDRMRGFYRSKYSVDGIEKHMATTQFESTDARRAFPSFDEPSHKATFEVSLMVPPNLTAFSNTIETVVREHESGYKIFDFETTPKMSTYLLAFIIGEFDSIEGKSKRGVRVRVSVTPGKKKQAEFALSVAIKCLDFFEDYFDISYPLPVLDLLAIPDFSAGAMENWGAITYREVALLVDEEHTSTAAKEYVAIVIAHELAHQWFGNLVTMQWWTHLWLNEGFASYIEFLAIDKLFPEWEMWTQFVEKDHNQALSLDALDNTHPIEVEVHHPSEISEIFDAVSYSKGASILRMLANYLGETAFRDGLRHYLKKHAYSNASTLDLWHSFEQVSQKPVGQLMKNWTSKPGYPLVSVKNKGQNLELKQARFYASSESRKKSLDKTIWSIPISIAYDESSVGSKPRIEDKLLMTKKTLTTPAPKNYQWLKLNAGESNLYRTDYSPALLQKLESPIKNKTLGTTDRLGIIRDIFDLSRAGTQSTDQALRMALSFKNEDEYPVWSVLSSSLHQVRNLISDDPKALKNFNKFGLEIFSQITPKLGWTKKPGEKHTNSLLRSLSLSNYGDYGDESTIKKAQLLFDQLVSGKSKLEPDLKGVVYTLVAKNGGQKEYNQLLKMYHQTEMVEEKNRLSGALGFFKNKNLLKKTLQFALSKDVRSQDSFRIIHFVYANPNGREIAWEYVQENWPELVKRFGGGGHLLVRLISPLSTFTSLAKAKQIKTFFEKNPTPEAARTISQVLEQIESNAAWFKRDGFKITNFLATYTKDNQLAKSGE